jgi:hypothetical protein
MNGFSIQAVPVGVKSTSRKFALFLRGKGERKAHTYDKRCYRQLRLMFCHRARRCLTSRLEAHDPPPAPPGLKRVGKQHTLGLVYMSDHDGRYTVGGRLSEPCPACFDSLQETIFGFKDSIPATEVVCRDLLGNSGEE